jgi:L-ascorbate metabolism protein UlaG (beta-lactamase superfamily)
MLKFSAITAFFILFAGCVQMTVSSRRVEQRQSLCADSVAIVSTGAININVPLLVNHADFYPSSFKIEDNGTRIYIDPVKIDNALPADYILITHAHTDHFSIFDIKKLLKNETIVIGPKSVCSTLSKELPVPHLKEVKPGDSLHLNNLCISAVAAYNRKGGFLGITPHSKSSLNVGYVVTTPNISIYHAGDTDYVPEMDLLRNITVALVPIDGGNLTMSAEKAAEFINHLRPKYVFPMHYQLQSPALEKFKQLVNHDIIIRS